MVSSILPKNERKLLCPQFFKNRTKIIILTTTGPQDNYFRSVFGRIEDTINCFRDFLTFKKFLNSRKSYIFRGIGSSRSKKGDVIYESNIFFLSLSFTVGHQVTSRRCSQWCLSSLRCYSTQLKSFIPNALHYYINYYWKINSLMLLPDVLKVITALFRSASQASSAVPAMLKYVCME